MIPNHALEQAQQQADAVAEAIAAYGGEIVLNNRGQRMVNLDSCTGPQLEAMLAAILAVDNQGAAAHVQA